MSVYVDPLFTTKPTNRWPYRASCHMFADTTEELVQFASSIGMNPKWLQRHPRLFHFDLTASRREHAVAAGAIEVDREFMVKFMRSEKS